MRCWLLLLLMVELLRVASPAVYYVIPDDQYPLSVNSTYIYLNDTSKYLASGTKLWFFPGEYHLQNHFVLENVESYAIEGDNTKIYCRNSSSTAMSNVSSLKISNAEIIGCGKLYNTVFSIEHNSILPYWNGALYFYYCSSVKLNNISVVVTAGVTRKIGINISRKEASVFRMKVNCNSNSNPTSISGIIFYCYDNC